MFHREKVFWHYFSLLNCLPQWLFFCITTERGASAVENLGYPRCWDSQFSALLRQSVLRATETGSFLPVGEFNKERFQSLSEVIQVVLGVVEVEEERLIADVLLNTVACLQASRDVVVFVHYLRTTVVYSRESHLEEIQSYNKMTENFI